MEMNDSANKYMESISETTVGYIISTLPEKYKWLHTQ